MMPSASFPDLKDRSVFITGGGSGIGAALTEGFLRQGAKVAFVQRSDATGFCDRMERDTGLRPLFLPCDITDISALEAALADAAESHGPVTVLVNNAADDTRHTIADTGVADWDRSIAVNLRPHFFTVRAALPGMIAAGGGSVINFSSITYLMGLGGLPAYVASKAAITGLTRAQARELGHHRIRVNAVLPGWVLTERQLNLWATPEALDEFLPKQCLPEHLYPDDMVGVTLFLASDSSRMMTGQALVVDGGVVVTG